jgi:hypothetical protein
MKYQNDTAIEPRERARRRRLWIAGLLTVLALFAGLLYTVAADTDVTVGKLTYTLNESETEATIKDCEADAADTDVTEAFGIITGSGITIKIIGSYAFYGCTGLTSFTVPDTVTSIGDSAFRGCTDLTSFTVPDTVTSIGDSAFRGCTGLTSFTVPAGVTSIGSSAFEGCTGLTSVIIPDGVTSIASHAFYGCTGLTAVTVPDTVTSIGDSALRGCTGLTNINVAEGNARYEDNNGVLFDREAQIILFCPTNRTGAYIIQDGVMSIGSYAFYGCTGLTAVTVPDTVTSIGDSAFEGCTGLTTVDVAEGNPRYEDDDGVLIDRSRQAVLLCPAKKTGGHYAIPDTVTRIAPAAFRDCADLKGIDIPDGVTDIGSLAFARSGITTLDIPSSVTQMNSTLSTYGISAMDAGDGDGDGGGSGGGGGYTPPEPTPYEPPDGPFGGMNDLRQITFRHGMEELPESALCGEFYKQNGEENVKVYVPISISSVNAYALDYPASPNISVYGVAGSYIEQWAADNNIPFASINAEVTKYDYDDAYRLVPYQYIIETDVPENANLSFEVVGGALPQGLSLLQDGQFHGAPLETGKFTFEVAVYFSLFGEDKSYIMDLQEITLTVEEPTDAMLAALTSDDGYGIDDFIGEPAVPSIAGNYVLRGSRAPGGLADQIFEVADSPEDEAAGLSNYRYFVGFWLDGRRLNRGPASDPNAEYDARDGSTVVTVYAKTFQSLDNGTHTVAAEFMLPNPAGGPKVQKVAAQRFTLELTNPPASSGGSGDGGGVTPALAQPQQQTPPAQNAAAAGNPFGDVNESDWFYGDVVYVCENGLMEGTSPTTFSPKSTMTRGMLVTVLGRFCGADEDGYAASGFGDVPAGQYYTAYVAWAEENGIVSGTGRGFAPDAAISRQDLATILVRCADFADRELPAARANIAFTDAARTADYAREAVAALSGAGIVNGKPGARFDPRGTATRAEVAAMLHRFIEATK